MLKDNPVIERLSRGEEVLWISDKLENRFSEEITERDIGEAAERLTKFAPYLALAFDGTDNGIIESQLVEIEGMREILLDGQNLDAGGRLFLKCDNALPVSGSIKARGGVYEVLCYAEKIALKSGMLKLTDNYAVLIEKRFRRLFSGFSVAVGSTGNLGLSIGIIGKKLGFSVNVHMSMDARQWKKDLLRKIGATVIEYEGDYEKAVSEGRKLAASDPKCHFVDDENSKTLFLGYAVAGARLAAQLKERNITVDFDHPLFVYLPCGVGGGPGGVTYGIKQIFGGNAHCFFAEPINAPCVLLGVMTGLYDKISALDVGLSGKTSADGLAVTRPSKLVCRVAGGLLDGIYTVSDERMKQNALALFSSESIFVETSAAAGFYGYTLIQKIFKNTLPQIHTQAVSSQKGVHFTREQMQNSTHIVWATGGSMVPPDERVLSYGVSGTDSHSG